MLNRTRNFLIFINFCGIIWLSANSCQAQNSFAELQKVLREKAAFAETDFNALAQGETVVKLLPYRDKREVAVAGLVPLQITTEMFLQSFRENMTRKSNPAILEIGSFSSSPMLEDLQLLTFDYGDIEDLKECVVGDCQLKLSATMIERLHREVDWEALDYQAQASQVLRLMLLDYVRDYVARGDVALIEYNDKQTRVRLAEEQRDLMAALSHDVVTEIPLSAKSVPKSELSVLDHAIVWSKIKFGLKPVIAINDITIYKSAQKSGPQILIASKQIYANHYFDSSLALTAFLSVSSSGSYLFYENRSRADGLGGLFSDMKRGLIESRALDSVKTILHQSQQNLEARALNRADSSPVPEPKGRSWKRWKPSRTQMFLVVLWITAFVALFGFRTYEWKAGITRGTHP